jgi:hypothetical protein
MTNQINSDFPEITAFSDAQMDGLLRDFFRLETPTSWKLPEPRQGSQGKSVVHAASASMTILASQGVGSSASQRGRRGVVMTGTLTVLALSLVLIVSGQSQNSASSVVNALNATHQQDKATAAPSLISPQGDSGSSENPVSDDGLLLKEADQIQLNPMN